MKHDMKLTYLNALWIFEINIHVISKTESIDVSLLKINTYCYRKL